MQIIHESQGQKQSQMQMFEVSDETAPSLYFTFAARLRPLHLLVCACLLEVRTLIQALVNAGADAA